MTSASDAKVSSLLNWSELLDKYLAMVNAHFILEWRSTNIGVDDFVEPFPIVLQEIGKLEELTLAIFDRFRFPGPVASTENSVSLECRRS